MIRQWEKKSKHVAQIPNKEIPNTWKNFKDNELDVFLAICKPWKNKFYLIPILNKLKLHCAEIIQRKTKDFEIKMYPFPGFLNQSFAVWVQL